jgi:hypothetical protein
MHYDLRRRIKVNPTMVQQLIRVSFFGVQFATAYILMLLAMYYNGYIIGVSFTHRAVLFLATYLHLRPLLPLLRNIHFPGFFSFLTFTRRSIFACVPLVMVKLIDTPLIGYHLRRYHWLCYLRERHSR